MNSILIRKKVELFLQAQEQIEKSKAIKFQSRKTVEQAKRQNDRMKNESGTYFPSPKDSTAKSK